MRLELCNGDFVASFRRGRNASPRFEPVVSRNGKQGREFAPLDLVPVFL